MFSAVALTAELLEVHLNSSTRAIVILYLDYGFKTAGHYVSLFFTVKKV